jgi:hypothetical protein
LLIALRRFPSDAIVEKKGVGLLGILLAGATLEVTQRIIDAQGTAVIVQAMRSLPNDRAVQVQACSAMLALSAFTPAARRGVLGEAGCVEGALQAARSHIARSDSVVKFSLCALANLVLNHKNAVRFQRADGFSVLAAAASAFGDKSELMQQACRVLANMTTHRDMVAPAVDASGIRILLDAMRSHPDSNGIQRNALSMLMDLAATDHAQQVAAAPGVMALTLTAIRCNSQDAQVQENGFLLVQRIAYRDRDCMRHFMRTDGIALLMAALRTHADSATVQFACLCALGVAAMHVTHCGAMVNAPGCGVLPRIVRAMQAFPNRASMALQGCVCIANISGGQYSREAARAGGIGAVVAAMKAHAADHRFVAQCGARALLNMARDDTSARLEIGRAGGIELLVKARRKYRGVDHVAAALRELMKEPTNRSILASAKRALQAEAEQQRQQRQQEQEQKSDSESRSLQRVPSRVLQALSSSASRARVSVLVCFALLTALFYFGIVSLRFGRTADATGALRID